MNSQVVQIYKEGRLTIPKMLGIVEECYVEIRAGGDKIVLKLVKFIADKIFWNF